MQPGQPDPDRPDPDRTAEPRHRPGSWTTPPPADGFRFGTTPAPPAQQPAPAAPTPPGTPAHQPGAPVPPQAAAGPVDGFASNLATSVVMFVLFPPFALPATIDAYRARVAYQAGDRVAADDAANESRRWSRIALIAGIVSWALLVCCGGVGLVLRKFGLLG